MRIALINPPRIRLERDPVRAGTPTGLLSLAAVARRTLPKADVHFIDAMAEGKGEEEIKPGVFRHGLGADKLRQRLAEIRPDVVGVSSIFTAEWQSAAFCTEIAREANPDARILLGGHHASAEPEFMLRNTKADIVAIGEAEGAFCGLLGAIACGRIGTRELARIRGIAFMEGGRMVRTGQGNRPAELDELPDPAFDLLRSELYPPSLSHSGLVPDGCSALADVLASRGCPNKCTYCTTPAMWGPKVRAFSPERIRGQIRALRDSGFDHVSIEDDHVLLVRPDTLRAMFTELKGQGIRWNIDAGIFYPLIRREFAGLAAENGCYRIFMPIEHPALDIMHGEGKYKRMTAQGEVKRTLAEAFGRLAERGIEFYAAIMVGFRRETERTLALVKEYAEFVMEQGANCVGFFYPKPLPGTPDYKEYDAVPEERRWENAPELWTLPSAVLKPDAMSIEELTARVEGISFGVNGRPNRIFSPRDGKQGG